MHEWRPYVPVHKRRAKALREMKKLRKKGKAVEPVEIDGRTIARSFWGKGWCKHLESFSDFSNRLPRGRTYVRNGSVCHLEIQPGQIQAIVSGSSLYKVTIDIAPLTTSRWKAVKRKCAGQIGSMLELLQGKLSDQVMGVVSDRKNGLFPQPGEINFDCSCPDWAEMCKHVAATLYGVGSRLDHRPELLFLLRDVEAQELIAAEIDLPASGAATDDALADEQLADIFGIDLEIDSTESKVAPKKAKKPRPSPAKPVRAKGKPKAGPAAKSLNAARKSARLEGPARPAATKRTTSKTAANALPRIRPTGKSVARLRQQLGLSVAQFARELGVTAPTVYRWEAASGRLNLRARPLVALAALQQQANEE